MKKIFTIVSAAFLLINVQGYSQAVKPAVLRSNGSHASSPGNTKMNWLTSDNMPGNLLAFEENKGQFPASANGWTILYGCSVPGIDILLTNKGIIYNISKSDKPESASKRDEVDPDKGPLVKNKIRYQHIFIGFEGCSENSRIEAQSETPYYFCEGMNEHIKNSFSNIKGFKKIIYHNLYPGVDLEFTIHGGKGIKYAIKVKPGFNPGDFKMHYSGTALSLDSSGNLHLGTLLGDIIDKAPMATSGGNEISSSFQKIAENEISFKLNNASKTNEIVIDPWTVFPIVSGGTYACDIGMDASSNTYVLEYTYSSALLMYVQKYNPLGALVWTYTLNEFTSTPFNTLEVDSISCSPYYFSDFVTDQNGNSYIVNPLFWANPYSTNTYGLVCLNTLGQRNYLDYNYSADSISETWNMAYSCADSLLIEGGCLRCCDYMQASAVNMTTGNPYPGEYANLAIGEIYAGTIAPNGLYYALTAIPGDAMSGPDNLVCCNITHSRANFLWQLNVSYPDIDYNYMETPNQLGTNGIAASCSYLYTTDGTTLDQRDLTSGAIINTTTIPNGNSTLATGTATSGLAVNLACGDVYAGSDSAIYVYDENLNPIGSYTHLPGRVLDVAFNNGIVSACGESNTPSGFLVQVTAQTCATGITISHTNSSCSGNNGTATASASFCTGPYKYVWSPSGQTTQTATGLSSGVYTVSISPAGSCFTISDTVTIRGGGGAISASKDSVCSGDTVTLGVDSVSGMTFKWAPGGETTANIHATITSTTTFTAITNGGPCANDTTYFTISTIHGVTGSVTAVRDTICPGGTATLSASGSGGTITYKWNTGATTSSINVNPPSTTTYTATIYGTCDTIKKPITVTVEPLPVASFTGSSTQCTGFKDTVNVSGGCSYVWNNGSTATTYYTGDINADSTIYVTVKSCFGCVATDSFKITPKNPVAVSVNNGTICPGSCITLTAEASGVGLKYNWNMGATTDTVTVCPAITTTYTVKVSNGCITSKVTTVTVNPFSISACCDTTITQGQSTPINAGGSSQYTWTPAIGLNCDTCPNVIASPTVTTTYTVTGKDANGCENFRVITIIVDIPCLNFAVPNVFTPTNAGLAGMDNIFYIKTENLSSWSIIIYDRWGKEMYSSTNPDQYWTGTAKGGGEAPAGVYYYLINATCQGASYKKDGYVQLIR